jgi:hypothetical protein
MGWKNILIDSLVQLGIKKLSQGTSNRRLEGEPIVYPQNVQYGIGLLRSNLEVKKKDEQQYISSNQIFLFNIFISVRLTHSLVAHKYRGWDIINSPPRKVLQSQLLLKLTMATDVRINPIQASGILTETLSNMIETAVRDIPGLLTPS